MLTGITCVLLPTLAKFSRLNEEEVQVATPEKELSLGVTAITKGIPSTPLVTFSSIM